MLQYQLTRDVKNAYNIITTSRKLAYIRRTSIMVFEKLIVYIN